MEKRNPNHKKAKDKSQAYATKSNDGFKNNKKADKSIWSEEVKEKVYECGNFPDKSKSEKHNVSYSENPTAYQESSDDESVSSTADFFKPVFESKGDSEVVMKEKIVSSVNKYKNSRDSFCKIYHKWLPERENTLEELQSLLKEIHEKTTNYYKSQAAFKEISYTSRCFKQTIENQTMDFFASFAAFVSDAASGITSVAQAFQMDSYQSRFQEIMDKDAKITKALYVSRSQCISEYKGIEEVIRKVHPNTLISTADKISDALLVHKHWAAMQNAYEENDMPKLLSEVCKFFDNACRSDVFQNVGASVNRFITDNPAALEACKSTGRAIYGAIDTFSEKKKDRNAAVGYINKATNLYLMLEDKKEIDHLRSMIHEDTHQTKLESQIDEAIDSLENEMKEMKNMYFNLFNIYYTD